MMERHHFVPKFYLDGFVDPSAPPYLYIYDKERPDIRRAGTRDAGLQRHYHSFLTKEGSVDSESMEKVFAQAESQAAPVFQKIVRRMDLDNKERSAVSFFIALMMTRVPNFRARIEQHVHAVVKGMAMQFPFRDEAMAEYLEESKEKGKEVSAETLREAARLLEKGEIEIKILPHYSLAVFPKLALELAPLFHKMNWVYIVAADSYRFVTSDNPLAYVIPGQPLDSPTGVGVQDREVEVTLPLTQNVALVATWHEYKQTYYKGTNRIVREINYRTIANAERFVYAGDRSRGLSKIVQRHRGCAPKVHMKTIEREDGLLFVSTFNPAVRRPKNQTVR